MDGKKRVRLKISGRVQGVCFRMETQKAAASRGVSGWVKNLPDGRVEAVLEGDEPSVNSLVQWCGNGPALSRVEDVVLKEEPYSGEYSSFDITY